MKQSIITTLFFVCITFSALAQKGTPPVVLNKNGTSYNVITNGNKVTISLVNNTGELKIKELDNNYKVNQSDLLAEKDVAWSYINHKNNSIYQCIVQSFLKVFKKGVFNGYKGEERDKMINGYIVFGQSGEIISTKLFMKYELAQYLTYDKLIEFEHLLRTNYKIPPFKNKKVKYLTMSIPLLTTREMKELE